MDAEQQTSDGAIGRKIQLFRSRVIKRHERGRTMAEIAFELGISTRVVHYIIADHTGEPGPNDPSPEEIEERCRQIRSGEVTIVSGYRGGMPRVRTDGVLRRLEARLAGLRGAK